MPGRSLAYSEQTLDVAKSYIYLRQLLPFCYDFVFGGGAGSGDGSRW